MMRIMRESSVQRVVQVRLRRVCCLMLVVALSGAVACVGSKETTPLTVETGRNAQTTHDGLVRMRGSAFEGVWVKPGADIDGYTKLMIGPVRMSYKRPPRGRSSRSTQYNFALTQGQADRLEELLVEALSAQIEQSERWTLTDEPGPDVLLIEPSLLDLVVNTPTQQEPRQVTFTTSTATVTIVLEVYDSQSGEILARMADRSEARRPGSGAQQLYWSNPVSNVQAVRTIFRRWSRIFVARLDTASRLSAEQREADAKKPKQDEEGETGDQASEAAGDEAPASAE